MSEVETAFIIFSQDQKKVIRIIRKLILDKGYIIEQKGILKIEDIYFDRKDEFLGKEKIALRVRLLNQTSFKITLKIPKKGNENYFERLEIEKPWSKEALKEIISNLETYFNINISDHNTFDNDPEITLTNLDFKVIQRRETYRDMINALNKKSKQIEYEFAIDNTTYIIKNYRISIIELEIESKIKHNNNSQLINFVNELKNHHGLFEFWHYSKLVTGKAIEKLLANNELKENHDFDNNNILTYAGLEKIKSIIIAKNI